MKTIQVILGTLLVAVFCVSNLQAQKLRVEGSSGDENTAFSGGFLLLGSTSVGQANLGLDANSIQARLDGGISTLFIQEFGGNTILNNNGGQVGISTSTPDAKLHILGGTDVNSADGGYLIHGSLTGTNLGIDNNEIQARFNGESSTLFINPEGGNITMARDDGGVAIGRDAISNVSLAIENLEENNLGIRVETNDSMEEGVYFTSVRITNTGADGTALDLPAGFARKAGGGSWAGTSDERTKKDITAYTEGLDIVNAVNPVWYTYNGKGQTPEGQRFVGVIAQELKEVAQHMVIPGQDGYMAVDPSAFTYMLINAVQELDADNKAKDQQLRTQNERIEQLEDRLAEIEALLQGPSSENNAAVTLTDAILEQNQPNPFQGSTTIGYSIPEGVQKAELRVTDLQGRLIKSVAILTRGEGQTTFDMSTLSNSTYQYSLFLDGKWIDTKQMVVTKR